MNTEKFKKPSYLMLLGGDLLAIIGCFLPFVSVFGMGVSYISGDGKFVVILSIVSAALAVFKVQFAFVPNIISLIFVLIGIMNTAKLSLNLLGVGAYIVIIANIVAILGALKAKKEEI